MRICAAQTAPAAGNIDRNIASHLAWIDRAAATRADVLVFPELSLTGYEPTLAAQLAMRGDDVRLGVFQQRADRHDLVICVGLPLPMQGGVCIAMAVFRPRSEVQIHAKQLLHADERPWFIGGSQQLFLPIAGHLLAPAICFESLQAEHAEHAAGGGADIYLASVAKSQRGVTSAYRHYPEMARKHFTAVLMANAIGHCDNFVSAGQSAVWNSEGRVLASLDDRTEGLVWMDTRDGSSGTTG